VRIGINGWRMIGRRTGVGRYLLNLVAQFEPPVVCGRAEAINLYIPQPLGIRSASSPRGVSPRVVGPPLRLLPWENLCMSPVVRDDVLLCPSYTRPLLTRATTVVTTHDVTMHMRPDLYPGRSRRFYDRLYGWSARNAALVVTATETGRHDVARCYGVPLEQIRVVPLAIDEHIHLLSEGDPGVAAARTRILGADVPYFLFVGKFAARRNIEVLIRAFAELKGREPLDHRLLLVGLNTAGVDLPGLVSTLGLEGQVVHREYISDEELNLLYNGAEALVIPSVFETLSLPAIEAQATGAPVITIDTPGLRETTGGAAYLMPTADLPTIVAAMSRIAGDEILRSELAAAGREHAAGLSWRRSAVQMLDVLEEAVGLPPSQRPREVEEMAA
jgi:glycosyltransferase involved in cell wall biosynthesis